MLANILSSCKWLIRESFWISHLIEGSVVVKSSNSPLPVLRANIIVWKASSETHTAGSWVLLYIKSRPWIKKKKKIKVIKLIRSLKIQNRELEHIRNHIYPKGQSLGSVSFFNVFKRSLLCSTKLHLFEQNNGELWWWKKLWWGNIIIIFYSFPF